MAAEAATLTLAEEAAQRQQESVFTELLGLETFINCTATYTVNGGSMMLESVRGAMARAGLPGARPPYSEPRLRLPHARLVQACFSGGAGSTAGGSTAGGLTG